MPQAVAGQEAATLETFVQRTAADFRSDTVTRPDALMRARMAEALVGDDVFGDDPTVQELETLAAGLLGHEAALFCPSGTMANQIAMRVHTRPGDEVILHEGAHIYRFEQGGLAALHGVQAVPLPGPRGQMDLAQIAAAIRADDAHLPRTRVVAIENTHNLCGGTVLDRDWVAAVRGMCDAHALALHLDGARLANAAVAAGLPLAAYAGLADSVTLCLSKGLGAPAGTMLAGRREFIRAARRARKLLGGGLRQVGILAAAGLIALREGPALLAEDHRRARWLAEGLRGLSGLSVNAPETNLVLARVQGFDGPALAKALEGHGVRVVPFGQNQIRLALHKDLGDEDVRQAFVAFERIAAGRPRSATETHP